MTDNELKRLVTAELNWDPAVRSAAIGVAVKDGVVSLVGHLDTLAERDAAVRALQRVAGVKAAAVSWMSGWPSRTSAATPSLPPAHSRRCSGTRSSPQSRSGSRSNTAASPSKARSSGTSTAGRGARHSTAHGSHRRSERDHTAAQTADRGPRPTNQDALTRQALREARQIRVAVEGETVKLTGLVNSSYERDAVERIAWQAPGVNKVVNELVVA